MGENSERSKMYQGNTSEKVYLWMWIVEKSTSGVLLARRKRIKEELSSSKLSYFILANFPLQNYLVAASFLHTWHTGMSYMEKLLLIAKVELFLHQQLHQNWGSCAIVDSQPLVLFGASTTTRNFSIIIIFLSLNIQK